ncbi:MAG: DinB family protein [Nocardioidaceae bacterium]
MTPDSIATEMHDACRDFHRLVDGATTADLRKRSDGTRWTNDQLLLHMLFGYLVVRALLWLVRGFSILPARYSRDFARVLNTATRPSTSSTTSGRSGARVLGPGGMERAMDNVTDSLIGTLHRASEKQLAQGMHFPVGWDPYFSHYMTVQDVLHYATQHYEHHRRQLTLSNA